MTKKKNGDIMKIHRQKRWISVKSFLKAVKTSKFLQKILKKGIDKKETAWYNMQVAARKRVGRSEYSTDEPRVEKIFEKTFQKPIDKRKTM